ncbi:MAG: tat pathway signal sequence domain protein [Nitrospira sp.]|nr:tat pathway signal sequence domain protein [Nitrospira sp.]MBH0184795.1 tat pathway signal sequence domain protein [Nitrospira sp.]
METMKTVSAMTIVLLFFTGLVPAVASQYFERKGLAIEGYDPVAYFTVMIPTKGSSEFRADHHGSTFYFTSAAHRDAFVADPSKYAPQYGGYCAYGMAKGYKAAVDPAAFTLVGGKLYLNYSETVRSHWLSDIPGYIGTADANWPEVKKLTNIRE